MMAGDEDVVCVGEQKGAEVAAQLESSIQEVQGVSAYTDTAGCVIGTLITRVRRFMMRGLERHDVVQEYASCATGFMLSDTRFEHFGRTDQGGRINIAEDVMKVNQWAVCV